MRKAFYLFLFLLCCISPKSYAISGDSVRISLLTVMPRPYEVYTFFGHTALRICDPSENVDVVVNYGMFDFNRPGFIYRFIKGETDYYMNQDDYKLFYYHYLSCNSTIIEQELNLPAREKEEMIQMLAVNLLPQNREYRYNYFFDNCTTRPRDVIERFCGGTLNYNYPNSEKQTTFRQLVHECTASYPWYTFGIDLLIGSGADSAISKRSEQFLPVKLMEVLDNATVTTSDGVPYPIAASSEEIMHASDENVSTLKSWSSPTKLGTIMVIHCLVFSIVGLFVKKTFRFFFSIQFLAVGLAGCVVAFVAIVSLHPCTWPNWNLLWIHPLHLIPAIGYLFKKTYRMIRWYHWSNFVFSSVLLLGWSFIPQELNAACIPFIICLWVSSGYKLLIDKYSKTHS